MISSSWPTFLIDKPIRLIELFGGYGSQHFALDYLGVKVEQWRLCEWAVKSIQAYKDAHFEDDNTDYSAGHSDEFIYNRLCKWGISANYNEPMTKEQIKRLGVEKQRQIYNNIKATHNLVNIQQARGDDLGIVDKDKYCYVMTYSFPCQDLSNAGKGAGMAKGSGTRSGMLWEVERLLDECKELPQVLLMENVPEVIGTNNIKHFAKWLEKLESLGYKCYWKVLNAKDYGVPQNRERCFMVSILGDYYYEFPKPIKLEHRLKDLLEDEVDEKYYLSDKMKEYIKASNGKWTGNDDKSIINRDIGVTINTRVGNTRADCSDYICDDLPENYNLKTLSKETVKQVGQIYGFGKEKNPQAGRIYDSNGLSPTLDTCTGGNRMPKIIEQINKKVYLYSKNKRIHATASKLDPTVDGQYMDIFNQTNKQDISGALLAGMDAHQGNIVYNNYRIRKLTPKECFRLMGVKDEDFEKIAKNQSNASLYHLAGDSIVVNVLMGIFGQMIVKN